MDKSTQPHGLLVGMRQILVHGAITLLAVVIAFSLPPAARYILFVWWPRTEMDANLLLVTETGLASALVLLFNLAKVAWADRHKVAMARETALVYARNARKNWLSRLRERSLVKNLSAARDACILTLTGYNTFVDERSLVREVLKSAYEIRVMLVNPVGKGLRRRVESLPAHVTALSLQDEIEASIAYLTELRKLGKKVALKFYDDEPFWKVVVLGDHAWVQYCHLGCELNQQPEYVFALQHHDPRQGLFVPFYMYFLERWNESRHPEYDFDANELVYRDAAGNETARAQLGVPINGAGAPASVLPVVSPARE
jgi:hypothetical protein